MSSERIEAALRPYVENGHLPGAVALRARGAEVDVACVGVRDLGTGVPMTRDTLFRIASLTKPLVAAVALMLVEDGTLALDKPVDEWLPELAGRPVLRELGAELDDVVPLARPITVQHVLTYTHGYGAVMAPPGTYPVQERIEALQLGPGADPEPFSRDEWMARLGTLPLLHQPGEGWSYHGGGEILGALLQRATGLSLETLLHERLFEPLGMRDTSYACIDPERLATAYRPGMSGELEVCAEPEGRWSPPLRVSGATGLISTVDDCLAFGRMLLDGGGGLLSDGSVAQMTTDRLTAQQKAAAMWLPGFWDGWGWGFGGAVATGREVPGPAAGSYGWTGGTGTACYTDLRGGRVGVLLTQREMTSPMPDAYANAFWEAF
ncbi:serine hydrolase domain-containing protein [Actinoplanes friuliensis]|uniref:Beta-lactamase class C-related penicillin binding protein n=1 Tax=Actinoplanes friuliensis DSM 7358 TaxID=1246995 RepID=U5WB27_9ACTN|nr:serine hydrolase domain-containing protein [Actinoplanes friuliensis]AGZ45136.1 Beta-lactamase class C-related penicillin binding protein [Actinoplanes friuliensis DSM 7358]